MTSPKPGLLHDIPPAVGGWKLSGKEVTPEGTERSLIVRLISVSDKYTPEVDVTIEADSYGQPMVSPILSFTRAAP